MTIDDIIAEGRRLEAAATPGEWSECPTRNFDGTHQLIRVDSGWVADVDMEYDIAFIAFARNLFLDLITALEEDLVEVAAKDATIIGLRAALAEREREVERLNFWITKLEQVIHIHQTEASKLREKKA